jgi:carbon-monoxide dehydrogenase medium subunit
VKLERKVGDFATAATAVQVTLGPGGEVAQVGIGLTNAGPMPLRAAAAEAFLKGKVPNKELIAEAARLASEATSPGADRRGAVEYKRQMSRVLTTRALQRAIDRASGKAQEH